MFLVEKNVYHDLKISKTVNKENKEVVEALDASITNKQDKISDTLILVDTITGTQHKIQIQNGQLVSFPIDET